MTAKTKTEKKGGPQGLDRRGRPVNPNSVRQIQMAVVSILKREHLVDNESEGAAKKGRVGRPKKVDK